MDSETKALRDAAAMILGVDRADQLIHQVQYEAVKAYKANPLVTYNIWRRNPSWSQDQPTRPKWLQTHYAAHAKSEADALALVAAPYFSKVDVLVAVPTNYDPNDAEVD